MPAHKKAKMIGAVIETMPGFVDHIVIVDDCSPDATSEVVRSIDDPRVTLIRHEANQGVGGAIITTHKAAMELGADANVVMAGDVQMDPNYSIQLRTAVLVSRRPTGSSRQNRSKVGSGPCLTGGVVDGRKADRVQAQQRRATRRSQRLQHGSA